MFVDYDTFSVNLANGANVNIEGRGSICLETRFDGEKVLNMDDVLYVSELQTKFNCDICMKGK